MTRLCLIDYVMLVHAMVCGLWEEVMRDSKGRSHEVFDLKELYEAKIYK